MEEADGKEIEEVEIKVEGSIKMEELKGYTKREYLQEESSLETDASMLDIDDEASVQAQLQHELRQSQESTAEAEEENEVDYAAKLARHLLRFYKCNNSAY